MMKRVYHMLPYNVRRKCYAVLKNSEFKAAQKLRIEMDPDGYSFRPFDEYRCIFIHIPKAAGVSVSKALFRCLGGGHTTVAKYQKIFSEKDFRRYFKFTFVRNPWDRVFSAYNFLVKGGMYEEDRLWADEHISKYENFESFVMEWLEERNLYQRIHFLPQYEFLCPACRDAVNVDFIGYFENISSDFDYIKQRLGLAADVRLHHENPTDSAHQRCYLDYYTDEMREVVARVYARDIDLLGYTFDNSSLEQQLNSRFRSLNKADPPQGVGEVLPGSF